MEDEKKVLNQESKAPRLADDSDDFDLVSILDEIKATNKEADETKTKLQEEIVKSDIVDEANLSPLERMKRDKESGKTTSGLIASNDEIEAGKERTEFLNPVYNDNRIESWNDALKDLDKNIQNRDKVTIVKQPQTQVEYVQLMDEIDSIKTLPDGSVVIDTKDSEGNPVPAKFIKLRGEGEPLFNIGELVDPNDASKGVVSNGITENKTPEKVEVDNKSNESQEEESDDDEEKELSPELRNTIKVIIDKTGFGNDFAFTEEEKKKIVAADIIQVNEVKLIDIEAIKAKRSERSFQEFISDYNTKGSRTTIAFPASGFKAQIKGMTYGEYADIALSMDNITFDLFRKRLTVIYNKMTDISTGPFKDFEDFLKNFAYTDIQLALYGLYVATESEEQEVPLQCGRQECGKAFDQKFSTRSLLRLDKCSETFLNNMERIATADASEYDKIREEAAVNNSKYIRLPISGYIVEMGIASAYDFLYNFIPLMDENTFKEAFGDDPANTNFTNVIFLTSVRSIRVPDGDNYILCEGYKDILDAIYNISPNEIKILSAYARKFSQQYEYSFALTNVVCPHCGHVTKMIPMEMDELVFQTYQRLTSTEIDLDHIQKI